MNEYRGLALLNPYVLGMSYGVRRVAKTAGIALWCGYKNSRGLQTYLTENASLNRRVTGSVINVKIDFLRVTISPVAVIPGVNSTS